MAVQEELEESIQATETQTEVDSQEERGEEPASEVAELEPVEMIEVEPVIGYQINKDNWKVQPLQDENEQVALLTIDDAPHQFSVEMAETLHELNVNAIFFINGHFIADEDGKEKLKRIHDLGFEIGNHTMSHPNMSQISEDEQRQEIVELNDVIEEIIGERPQFYRAPFGVNTETSEEVMAEQGMISMNWTYGYDWETEYQNAEALADIMVNTPYLTNGANLLMHDREWTAQALENIVSGLKEKGYEIVDPNQIETK